MQTGRSGFEQALGAPIFDWLGRHPAAASLFSETMIGFHGAEPAAVAEGYDFSNVTDRVTIQSGSFFDGVPKEGDAYLLSHIIHDWSQEQCLTILGHCRNAMRPDGRVLIIEMVLPEGDTPHPGKMLDLMMLVGPGGRERTAQEYGVLLGKAGFRLTRVVPTASPVSVVEAVIA